MNLSTKKMLEESMARIELLQLHISAVDSAASHLSRIKYHDFKVDKGNLRSALIEEELDEWRKLFMWGLVVDDELRERVKAAAYQRFLDQRNSVAQWLNPDGVVAGSWLQSEEDEFRKMVNKAFKPKGE